MHFSPYIHVTDVIRVNSYKLCVQLIVVMILIESVVTVPQIFNENYRFCEYDLKVRKKDDKLVFPDKLWTIDTRDFILHFSFCKTPHAECRNQTSTCLVKKSDNQMIDLGHEFQLVDPDNYIFESVNGAKCPYSDGSYAVTVTLDCSDTIKPAPRLMMPDDDTCHFEITMMRPNCQPKCTANVQNAYLIDLRKFPKNIDVETESKKFSFSVCGHSNKCGFRDVGACELLNDNQIPLSVTESQYVTYEINGNELVARGRYKEGRVIRELHVLIKCNWQTEMSNAKYKIVPKQGRKYKFELESSYGCIKLPQQCFFMGLDNSQYNLSGIYDPDGWIVSNVPSGRIVLNICGSLRNPVNTICSDQYSQVCHEQDNVYINRGSILTSLTVVDDVIKAVFSSGSSCQEDVHSLYSTHIEFHCSKRETGPIFKEFRNCTMFILWETPHACPVEFYKGQDCSINDRIGYRKLGKLFTETDRHLVPAQGTELIYNLCGPIHEKCNNFSNVSFCLKTDQHIDTVIGWDNRQLISDNGLLRLELTGSKCLNSDSYGKVNVNFICNYEEPSPPPQINVIEDGCIFNMTVFTSLACLSENSFKSCIYNINNISYDLSPLSFKDRNYIIRGDEGIEYILNVCGPIVTEAGALCRKNTMVCLRNKTEDNIKHQYVSLGGVSSRLFNNSLTIESEMGAYCEGYGHYKSRIHFECSQEKYPPMFLAKNSCIYDFIWKVPEACPKNCVINDSRSGTSLDLNNLEEKILKISVTSTLKYEFHLCKDVYVENFNGTKKVSYLRRKYNQENKKKYLSLHLQNNLATKCKIGDKINLVVLDFRCDKNSSNRFEEKLFDNCTLNIIVFTSIVCSDEHQNLLYSMEVPTPHPTSVENVQSTTERLVRENKCLLVSEETGYEFKLSQLKSKEIYNGTNQYYLNFDGKLNCDGILCKNNVQLLPMDACPVNTFNHSNNYVTLQYSTKYMCGPREYLKLKILLKCSKTKVDNKILQNTSCEIITEEHLSDVCPLFHEKPVPPNAIVIGIVSGVTIIVIALVCIAVNFFKKRLSYARIFRDSDKTSVPIYTRNLLE